MSTFPATRLVDARGGARAPRFDAPVAAGGYAWWYVDAVSTDGRYGLSVIALLGSVFSPYYARARARARARDARTDALQHCALNVALYGDCGHRWTMTERRASDVRRGADWLQLGPSALHWDGERLNIEIDEITVPLPGRVRGTIRVRPSALFDERHQLDPEGRHRWQPIAPRARIEVDLARPALRWSGDAYVDSNDGDRGLEDDFDAWTWSRTTRGSETVVFYDVQRRDGAQTHLALGYDGAGGSRRVAAPPPAPLRRTPWGIARPTRADAGSVPRVVATLEDGPFYARSLVATQIDSRPVVAVHESVSLQRFRRGWVRMLLPFRMPRAPARAVATLPRFPGTAG